MRKKLASYLIPALAGAAALALLIAGTGRIDAKTEDESARTLETAIRRAAVQCYAIEGRYPPSLAYMERQYGLTIDREKYTVYYTVFADNLLPDITILANQNGG